MEEDPENIKRTSDLDLTADMRWNELMHVKNFSGGMANDKFSINGSCHCYITVAGTTESNLETRDSWEFNCLPFSSKQWVLKKPKN